MFLAFFLFKIVQVHGRCIVSPYPHITAMRVGLINSLYRLALRIPSTLSSDALRSPFLISTDPHSVCILNEPSVLTPLLSWISRVRVLTMELPIYAPVRFWKWLHHLHYAFQLIESGEEYTCSVLKNTTLLSCCHPSVLSWPGMSSHVQAKLLARDFICSTRTVGHATQLPLI